MLVLGAMFASYHPRSKASFAVAFIVLGAVPLACANGEVNSFKPGSEVTSNGNNPPEEKIPETTPEGGQRSSDGAAFDGSSSDAGSDGSSPVGSDGGACATTAPSNACGLTPQCGCASNQTCDITNKSTGAVGCVAGGSTTLGNACTATSQCATGLTCAYGACRPYCAGADGVSCGAAGVGVCQTWYATGTGTAIPNGRVCTVNCDLANPSAACGSNTCIWDMLVKATDCDQSGGLGLYDACDSYNACAPGLACVNNPIFGFECEEWCRVGMFDCASFETCVNVYGADAPKRDGYTLGHCQ